MRHLIHPVETLYLFLPRHDSYQYYHYIITIILITSDILMKTVSMPYLTPATSIFSRVASQWKYTLLHCDYRFNLVMLNTTANITTTLIHLFTTDLHLILLYYCPNRIHLLLSQFLVYITIDSSFLLLYPSCSWEFKFPFWRFCAGYTPEVSMCWREDDCLITH